MRAKSNMARATVTLWVVITVLATVDAAHAVKRVGRVYILTEEIRRPREFTGVGEDTLRLNGIPFSPTRRKLTPPGDLLPPEERQRVAERNAGQHELNTRAWKAAKKHDAIELRVRAALRVYRESALVDSVTRQGEDRFRIYWSNGDSEEAQIPRRNPEPKSKREIHKGLMASFWRTMEFGCLLIIFSDGHSLSCPAVDVDDTVKVLEMLKKGEEVPEVLVNRSCLKNGNALEEFKKLVAEQQ